MRIIITMFLLFLSGSANASYIPTTWVYNGSSFETTTGNVGIGSTAPGKSLDVQGTVRASFFVGDGSGITGLSGSGTVNSGTANQAAYYATSTTAVSGTSNLIFNGSNVGIGSATPGQILDVVGTVRLTNLTYGATAFSGVTGTGSIVGASTPTITTPFISTVKGGSSGSSSLILQSTSSSVPTTDTISFRVGNNGGTVAATIIDSGNVGIGTTVPGQKLDVQGTIRGLSGGTCTTLYLCQGGVDAGVIQTSACVLCPASTCVAMNGCF